MPSPLFVGIDVSSKNNVVSCLTRDEEKKALNYFSVSNNRPGFWSFRTTNTSNPGPVLALFLLPVSWLKSVIFTSLKTIPKWLSLPALLGPKTNPEILKLPKPG